MRALSLNYHGLGNPQTVHELHNLVKKEGPNVVFLMETRLFASSLEWLRIRLNMRGCLGVERQGQGGGLALMWDASVNVDIQSYSSHHINAEVRQSDGTQWRITGFYGYPEVALRDRSWALLRHLGTLSDVPWLALGDFNEITQQEKLSGRLDRNANQMAAFREALLDCSLLDLGYVGPAFTWSNNRLHSDLVRARLDRGVANSQWTQLFPSAQVQHIPVACSDHMGIVIDTMMGHHVQNNPRRRKRLFRFEKKWIREAGCEQVIKDAWEIQPIGTDMYRVAEKIKQCRINLLQWSQTQVRVTPRLIEAKSKQLAQMEMLPVESYNSADVDELRRELKMLREQEETMWRQRSRVSWLADGDKNTKFFHECASQRRRTNTIMGLRDQDNSWWTEPADLERVAVDYFQTLFTSSRPTGVMEVVDEVERVVSAGMNSDLMRPFSAEEVHRALFQMHPSKAPGPDGMFALFFSKFWHIVGSDVSHAMLDFLNSGRMLGSINFTHLVLIPKVASPEHMSQFRPISLCNVLYKIASKVLVNRMKSILSQVISDSQSAFVPGRMITDNVIIAFETIHYLKNLRSGSNAQMAVKLDMSKAYDRVEWDYLQAIMLKLGFNDRWVRLIMECVSSVSYAVMVNGEPKGYIKPQRGLRQGDPLSPYLFLLCAEVLSALLRKVERDSLIKGVSICRGGPRISHLFFADDSIIFCRASNNDCIALSNILVLYANASGQMVNSDKTGLFFSYNTSPHIRQIICSHFGTSMTTPFDKYLGLPPVVG